jgi:hypothetical protein
LSIKKSIELLAFAPNFEANPVLALGRAKAKTAKKIIKERIKRRIRLLIFIALNRVFCRDFKNMRDENSTFLTLCLEKRWIKIGMATTKSAQRSVGYRKLNI